MLPRRSAWSLWVGAKRDDCGMPIDSLRAQGRDEALTPPHNGMLARIWMRRSLVLGLVIFVIAVFFYRPQYDETDRLIDRGYESFQLALSIVRRGAFADPFWPLSTGPSAHLPPVFPSLVAVLIRFFGAEAAGAHAVKWSAVLATSLQLALYPALAVTLGMTRVAGVLAALAWLFAGTSLRPQFEASFAALLIVLLTFGMRRMFDPVRARAICILTALGSGILMLTTPVALLPFAAWLLVISRAPSVSRLRVIVLVSVPLMIVGVWTTRNYMVFHEWVLVRDNFGLEMDVSNNSCATYSYMLNRASNCFGPRHPNESLKEAEGVRRLGEVRYNKEKMKQATAWIQDHPKHFVRLVARRFSAFWFPTRATSDPMAPGKPLIISFLTALSLPGLYLLWRRNRRGVWFCVWWLLLFPPGYYLIHVNERYRHPILWATLLPGCYFLSMAYREIQRWIGVRRERVF